MAESTQTPFSNAFQRIYSRVWSLHPPVLLIVHASRGKTLEILALAAKPSQQRLHLRDLFLQGRRYYISPHRDGLRVQCNSRYLWGGRRRTPFTAELIGALSPVTDDITSVRLRVRTVWFHVLRGLFIPAWMSAIVVSIHVYPIEFRVMLVTALFILSILGHRFSAALQASHLIFFVQKALEDLPPVEVPQLAAAGSTVINQPRREAFRSEWEKFYAEHKNE
jgi:hypothetical protein